MLVLLFPHLWRVRPTKFEPSDTVCSWIRKHWHQPNICLSCSSCLCSENATQDFSFTHSRNKQISCPDLPCCWILCPWSVDLPLPLESSLLVLTVSLLKSLHSPYPSCLSLLLSIDKSMPASDRPQLIDSLPAKFSSRHFCSIWPYEFPMDLGKGRDHLQK